MGKEGVEGGGEKECSTSVHSFLGSQTQMSASGR